jgi:hypothetical protein
VIKEILADELPVFKAVVAMRAEPEKWSTKPRSRLGAEKDEVLRLRERCALLESAFKRIAPLRGLQEMQSNLAERGPPSGAENDLTESYKCLSSA